MRNVSGFVLLAGVAVGLFVYLPAPVDRDITLGEAQRKVEQRAAESRPTSASAQPSVRTFSPGVQLTSVASTKTKPRAAATKVASDESSAFWQTSVVATDAEVPGSQYELVVDIQKQLKRLGCYYGRIDGSWGEGTKEAVTYFTSRVNAALPIEKPDTVLLTLLRAHNGKSCGASCPMGQSATSDGRCLPQAAAYGSQAPQSTAVQETLPWKANAQAAHAPQPLFRPVPSSVISTEPLPGRMAIGGPKALPPVDAANTQPGYNGYTQQPSQAAALNQDSGASADAPAAAPRAHKSRAESRRRSGRRREGPGTPRYNLMLSLGGVY